MPRDPIETLDKLEKALDKRVGGILWKNLTRLRDHLRSAQLLKTRTKGMPYVRRPIRLQGSIIEAGLYAPPSWAGVHIGPAGTMAKITPKRGQFLALPTDFVRQFRGHPVGPRQYSGTVIFGGIIWGKAGWGGAKTGGGLRQHRAAGEKFGRQSLIPLFILKKSVIIRKRLDPAQLIAWVKPLYFADLKNSLLVPV